MNLYKSFIFFILFCCNVIPPAFAQEPLISPLAIRALQTREVTGINQQQAINTGLATFQDLGFIITETSASLGLIKANQTRPNENTIIQATLTLVPSQDNGNKITVRLSLSYSPFYYGEEGINMASLLPRQSNMIKDPTLYQQFFNNFSYSVLMTKAS